jgi:myo-inositol 2-dehydrogenase / D-chiro-inositol 1-dehydrogenase
MENFFFFLYSLRNSFCCRQIPIFMHSPKNNSRRRFIKNAAAIGAGFFIVPRHVLGRGFLAPSDQLTKGIIGVGGMGRGHIPYAGTRVVAICDVDKNHLTEVAGMIGGGVKTFHEHQELIALPEVDIVHIATPPHWHGLIAIDAAKAGKDIWCEVDRHGEQDDGVRLEILLDREDAA